MTAAAGAVAVAPAAITASAVPVVIAVFVREVLMLLRAPARGLGGRVGGGGQGRDRSEHSCGG